MITNAVRINRHDRDRNPGRGWFFMKAKTFISYPEVCRAESGLQLLSGQKFLNKGAKILPRRDFGQDIAVQ
jgi:hypothetical protein